MKNLILILFLFCAAAYADDFLPDLKAEILKNVKVIRVKPLPKNTKTILPKLPTLKTSDSGNVGNGGGSIVCNDKRYALDYQIAKENDYSIISSDTTAIKMALILVQFEKLFPNTQIASKFASFVNTLFDNKLWLEFYYEADSAILGTKLYCGVTARQTIWRFIKDDKALYFYNQQQLEELAVNGDQLSWILTHEWIWDLLGLDSKTRVDLIETNISLNAFFHSPNFLEHDESEEIKSELIKLGLSESLFEKIPEVKAVTTTEDNSLE
jgi:hypothetical protein